MNRARAGIDSCLRCKRDEKSFTFSCEAAMTAVTNLAALTVTLLLLTCAPESRAQDVAGTYSGSNIKLELKSTGGEKYSGTIHFAGQQFPATVSSTANGLAGTFRSQGQEFQFVLVPSATGYTLITDGTEYPLTRQAVANPLAASKAAGASPEQAASTAAPQDSRAEQKSVGAPQKDPLAYKVRQLPGGTVAEFENWQYQNVPAGENMLIVDGFPQGHQKDFLLRTAVATPNSQDLANLFTVGPQLTQQLLSTISPTFQRVGEQKKTKVGGDDAMIEEYQGNINGASYHVRVLYVRREDVGMAVLGIGTDAGFKDYGRAIEIVAQSITFKQSPLEPELIGTWTFEASNRVEGVRASDSVTISSSRSLSIMPNSTFTDSNSGVTTGPGLTGLAEGGSRGKLIKRGNALTFHYDDGHTWSPTYEVGGGGLKLNGQLFIKQ
jgi:hypothetical protein